MKYMKLGSKPDAFQCEGNHTRFVATELATDIVITVGDVKFYLHKFPLLCKSARLQKLVAAAAATSTDNSDDEIDVSDIPGGALAFEACAKFCYGMIVTLNARNVVAVRCAAEYLEMHEAVEKGNLVHKIEVFLNTSVFRTWKDCLIALRTTSAPALHPWVEDLKIISRAVEAAAAKAATDLDDVDWSYSYNSMKKLQAWDSGGGRVPQDWWVNDVCELDVSMFKQIVAAIRAGGRVAEGVIGEALWTYVVQRRLLSNLEAWKDVDEAMAVLGAVVPLLPTESGAVRCRFLLQLLRVARRLDASEAVCNELMKRAGRQLDRAAADDLLALRDIDLVIRMVHEFVVALEEVHCANDAGSITGEGDLTFTAERRTAVATLIDGYLAEMAKQEDLPVAKFIELAEMAASPSRPVHDGLYRAIDMFLKEHPGLTKGEKKRLCSLMDCKKLSPEVSLHAVQNDRLPLRVVVQVLFFEQLRASASTVRDGHDVHGGATELPPVVNTAACLLGDSYGSCRSAALAEEDEWAAIRVSGDANSFRSMREANKSRGSERSCGVSSVGARTVNGDVKAGRKGKARPGMFMPKKVLSKLWSSRGNGTGENSNSDTSESPGAGNPEETKLTPARSTRHSVS